MLPNYWNPPATQGPTELLAGLDEVDWISGIPAGEVVNSPVTDDTIGSAALPEQSAANGGCSRAPTIKAP
ncbi:MAG: hypothetical protein HZY75_00285 [Nocardioidaceae bacterium]|nr:MAG: hypothetical protein HZY75_00285 [Nocardioidaceae bacterium]